MVDGGVAENSSAWKEVRFKESTKLCNNYKVVQKCRILPYFIPVQKSNYSLNPTHTHTDGWLDDTQAGWHTQVGWHTHTDDWLTEQRLAGMHTDDLLAGTHF